MDGIDGMTSLHAIIVLFGWVALSLGGMPSDALVLMVLAVGLLAFLFHNWSPARLFMGDVGSTFIGYTFGCFAVFQAPSFISTTNFAIWILLMMPFLFDTSSTLFTRMMHGEKWYAAHKSHLFQRLIQVGYSHSFVSSVYGMLTVWMLGLIWAVRAGYLADVLVALPLFLVPYLGLFFWVENVEREEFVKIPS